MELAQLEQFLMIEKSRSMRLAAEKLFLSQPSLSLNLKKLEDELDCKLFTRSNNQLILNDYGKIMLEYSERVIAEIQSAKRAIEEEKE
ncbi:MAG: LysR family transcriptional regulator, partial [Clostridiales Family XIII bacterium]|nr:LysR family transcriptional regulator [Clostridiales Family XIII bacterium]